MDFRTFKNTNCIGLDIFGCIYSFRRRISTCCNKFTIIGNRYNSLISLALSSIYNKKHFEKYKEPEEERLLYATLITISALVISFLLGYSSVMKSMVFGSAIILIDILPLLISLYARIWQKDKFLSYLFLSISLFVETMIVLVVLFSTFGL